MEPLIYFPTFEPPNEAWLKFALIYFENFRPIVPYSRQNELSDSFRRIQDRTDLITLYNPSYEQSTRASLFAIEETEEILNDTYARSPLFSTTNIRRRWEDKQNWNFRIYQEKLTNDWVRFCESNQIGRRENDGIMVSEELAFLYMTYLAKEIALSEDMAIITDNIKFDGFTNYARATTPSINKRTRFAKGIINLIVPKNLSEIPFSTLIKFRGKNRQLIRAFNGEIDNIQRRISEGYTEQDFIDSYNNIYSEFSKVLLEYGTGISSIPLTAYILINNSSARLPEYIKETLGALGMVIGGGYALNKALKDTESARYCKKYLTNLKRIGG